MISMKKLEALVTLSYRREIRMHQTLVEQTLLLLEIARALQLLP